MKQESLQQELDELNKALLGTRNIAAMRSQQWRDAAEELMTKASDCIQVNREEAETVCKCCGVVLEPPDGGHRADCLANAILETLGSLLKVQSPPEQVLAKLRQALFLTLEELHVQETVECIDGVWKWSESGEVIIEDSLVGSEPLADRARNTSAKAFGEFAVDLVNSPTAADAHLFKPHKP